MPTCDPTVLLPVIAEVRKIAPKSVLDVGCGMGKWGLLFREYLEGWGHHRYSRPQWKVRIDAVEIFQPYIQPWHHQIYSNIYVGDIRTMMVNPYDVVNMIDVIEHMPREQGNQLILKLLRNCKHILISTPNFPTRKHGRGAVNPHQRHHCRWAVQDFRPYKHKVLRGNKNERMIVVRIDR